MHDHVVVLDFASLYTNIMRGLLVDPTSVRVPTAAELSEHMAHTGALHRMELRRVGVPRLRSGPGGVLHHRGTAAGDAGQGLNEITSTLTQRAGYGLSCRRRRQYAPSLVARILEPVGGEQGGCRTCKHAHHWANDLVDFMLMAANHVEH